jgi:hypothetical protein
MARKKKATVGMAVQGQGGSDRMSTDISTAENGFIVNVSGESGGKNPSYFNKRFIATSRPHALRIAAHHMAGSGKVKAGKKKSKIASLKNSVA